MKRIVDLYCGILVLLAICSSCISCHQTSQPLATGQSASLISFHNAQKGQITFMNGYIPLDQFEEEDKLTNFDLTTSSNINMRTFLEQPLTSYLHSLAPELSTEQLCAKGNYQFRFYLDEEMVYEENLNTGAGSCEKKIEYGILSSIGKY